MTTQRATVAPNRTGTGSASRSPLQPARRQVLRLQGAVGRHLSVRWKLTLWYGMMCALTLGLLGLGMEKSFESQARKSIDSGLKTSADRILTQLDAPAVLVGPVERPGDVFKAYVKRAQKVLIQNSYSLSNPGGFEELELSSPSSQAGCFLGPLTQGVCQGQAEGLINERLALDGVYVTSSGQSRYDDIAYTGLLQHNTYSGERLRVFIVKVRPPFRVAAAGVAGFLVVLQPERTYLQFVDTINRILLLGVPLALIIALAVGWLIARAALRPIDRISRTIHSVGVSRDLSRRVDFVGPMDEVGRLAETFDGMLERLEQAFETQKRFVADASHELRTPLTSIRGNADLLAIAPPEERDVCVASIRREAERMSRLVADLLLLAAADVDEQPVHMRTVDLTDVANEVYRSGVLLAGDKVSLRADVSSPLVVEADPDRIKQLMLNLVDNAIKFTPAGGHVSITVRHTGDGVRIVVSDTGVGIPEAERQAIFERFYRVEQARATKGSGLGLAICAWIVQAHGGRIDVQSEVGEGTRFSVDLPGAGARRDQAA